MNTKFHTDVQQRDDATYIKISGVIDEDNELAALVQQLKTETVFIDLSEIERINSCGVRDWVNWLGSLEKMGTRRMVFIKCSPSIVNQINLVSNFTGPGMVQSFYAPYFCGNCDREKVLLVETRDMAGKPPYKAPSCRCDECDGPMEFDEMEESFFAFLSNSKKIVMDAAVEAVLSDFTGGTTSERKVRLRTSLTNPSISTTGSNTPSKSALGAALRNTGTFSRSSLTGSGTGQKWPTLNGGEDSNTSRRLPPAPEPRSAGAWILVGVLVAVAIALLAYVVFSGSSHTGQARLSPALVIEPVR
jgi:anti-anti-sigma regulatory factor